MEADMKTSNLINRLVLVDAILTMTLGLGVGLTAPALVLGLLVPVAGSLLTLFLLATVWTNDLTHDYVHENSAYST